MAIVLRKVAWDDETANLTSTAPIAITGEAANVGTGEDAVRHDHRHAFAPTENLDFNQVQALQFVVQNGDTVSKPNEPVEGQFYYDSQAEELLVGWDDGEE